MKQSLSSVESVQDSHLSKKELAIYAGAAVVGLTATAAVVLAGKTYLDIRNGGIQPDIGGELGIHGESVSNGSAQFHQDLEAGLVSINVPAIDVMHSHGDK